MKKMPLILPAGLRRAWTFATLTVAAFSAILLGGVSVQGQTFTNVNWIATSPEDYSTASGWDMGFVPSGSSSGGLTNTYVLLFTNGVACDYATPDNYIVGQMSVAPWNNSSGSFILNSGTLTLTTNNNNYALTIGGRSGANGSGGSGVNPTAGAGSVATFSVNGGTLNVIRYGNGHYHQDAFIVGLATNCSGTFNLNNGVVNTYCGIEIGFYGAGIFNMSGGTLMDNGWFGVGRGNAVPYGSGTFNMTGGAFYQMENTGGGTVGGAGGIALNQGCTNATVNISGGSIYSGGISFNGSNITPKPTDALNISGGALYIGSAGVYSNGGNIFIPSATISGGTFHTVDMIPTGSGVLANNGSITNVLSDGTNWAWSVNPPVNLTNSSFLVNGVSGPGYVTFAPEAGRTITLNNQWTGTGGMQMNGPGTLVLNGANNFSGPLTLNGGTLEIGVGQNDAGGLAFNGGNLVIASGSLADSTITIPGGSTLYFTNSSALTVTNVVGGAGNVAVVGAGTVNVGSNLQNTGAIIQNNGALVVNGSIPNASGITNSSPASVGLFVAQGTIASSIGVGTNSAMETGTTSFPGTLNASNVVLNGTWDVKISTATTPGGGTNDLLVCSNLTLNAGSSVLNVIALSPPTAGTYLIGEYSGTASGSFSLVTNNLRNTAMSVSISGGQVLLTVGASNPANLTWAAPIGASDINWDVDTSPNWTNSATSALDVFHQQDNVTFSGTPGATSVTNRVSLVSQILPGSITINGGMPYIFSGFGYIGGGTGITYNDTNTSGIYTAGNNFTGPVKINAGVLQLGIGGSGWLGVSNTTTINGGTLDLNGQSVGAEPLVIQGSGSPFAGTNNGAINNSGAESPQSGGPLNITLAGDTTLNASGARWDIGINKLGAGGGSFVGNRFNLTKIGSQQLWMHEVGDIGAGNIDIQQGELGFEYTIGMGIPSDTITVEPGATLGIYQLQTNSILNKDLVLNGNASVINNGPAGWTNNFVGPVTLNGTNSITADVTLNMLGNITGTGGFTLAGPGPLVLGGDDTYSGPTILGANSTIALGSGASIPDTSLIYMTPGNTTVLDASGAGSMTLNSGQTLEGAGSLIGNVTANSGSSIVAGTNATTYGTIVFTNNLTLNGDTNILKISDNSNIGVDNDLLQVNGTLTLNGISTLVVSPLAALNSGTPYTVMQAEGGITGSGSLTVVSTSPRYTMTPTINGNLVQVNIMGNAAPLLWQGYLTPNWDMVTSNWYNMATASHDHFYNGDAPTFDDTASITSVVLTNNVIVGGIYMSNVAKTYTFSGGGGIAGPINMYGNGSTGGSLILAMSNAPALTYVDSQFGNLVFALQGVTNYTVNAVFGDSAFTGAGIITFGGTNTALITGDNSAGDVVGSLPAFDGTIWVNNGVLRYTNQSAFGENTHGYSGIGPDVVITNNGTLDFNNVGMTYVTPLIEGNGFNGEGALYDSANNVSSGNTGGAVQYFTLAGNASIGSPLGLRWDQNNPAGSIGGQINGNGFKLTKVGLGTVFINAQQDGDIHMGDIEVAAGRLGFQGGPIALGNDYLNNVLSVDSNAIVTFYAISNEFDTVHCGFQKPLWLKGSAQIDSGGVSNNYSGPVFLSGTNLFGTRSSLHLWNSIMDSNGPGGFVLGYTAEGAPTADLWLDGTNSYSGPTIVSNRTVHVGANSSLGLSTYVQVNSGATLDLSAMAVANFGTVQTNQTLAGNGTINGPATGNLNFNAGGTLSIGLPMTNGAPETNTFTLAINNNVVFNPGSTNYVVANKASAAAGAVPADKLTGPTSLTLGGTVVITNCGLSFVAGDSLALFSATTITTNSNFNIVPATPGPNLAWNISTMPVDGTLRVVSNVIVNPNPTNILFTVLGNELTLKWPADHIGWELEIQTNSLSRGIGTNWVPYPTSTTTDSIQIPINLTNGTVFYRLVYPAQ